MLVTVMNVRKMGVRVTQSSMVVWVAVRLPNGVIRAVSVLVVFVVDVAMVVSLGFVFVFVLVPLRQVEPQAHRHQSARRQQSERKTLTEDQ